MRFSEIIFDLACNGDLQTRNENVPYSTSAMEMITVGEMMDFHCMVSEGKEPLTYVSKHDSI